MKAIDAEYQEPNLAVAEDTSSPLALPIVTNIEAKAAMTAYQQLCESVLSDDDYQPFKQWDAKTRSHVMKNFKKKSAVKKLQTFFGISVSIRETIMDQMGNGEFGFRVTAVATKRNGDSAEALGACSTLEDRFQNEKAKSRAYHDVLATAETRATNRAVMNAIGVGGGEVTAEEMPRDDRRAKPQAETEHSIQLRKAAAAYKAYHPEADNETMASNICRYIAGKFMLDVIPTKSSQLTVEQLTWAAEHFTKLREEAVTA